MPEPEIRPATTSDWWICPWVSVWHRTRLAPHDVPGVRMLKNGRSLRAPFPYEVHTTHLRQLGYPVPGRAGRALDAAGKAVLRAHQLPAVEFIRSRRGTLLADEQRVGKSAAVMYAHDPRTGPLMMLGPVAARAVWHEWAARRFGVSCVEARLRADNPRARSSCAICERVGVHARHEEQPCFLALDGRAYRPELIAEWRPQVMFATFAVSASWRKMFADVGQIGTLGVDEAHLCVQNRKNVTVESIRWFNTVAYRCVMISGTPLANRVAGLWPMLDIAAPGAFGSFWPFARRFCGARPGAYGWTADGESNMEELKLRLEEVMLRRRWIDVRGSLPPISRAIETVALPREVRDEVEELAARIRQEKGGVTTMAGNLARLRKMYASLKAPRAVELAQEYASDGHSSVLWVWHTDVAHEIVGRLNGGGLRAFGPIVGATSPSQREAILEEARRHPGPRVLVANMASLGVAVSLAWASHEVFAELAWDPHHVAQAEMRPFDGEQAVSAVYLVADVDADERLANALITKLETQGALGLRAGVGDVAEVLRASFGGDGGGSLEALAERLIANAEGEI